MAFLSVKNNASSVLAADITDVATSLTVASGEGARFPTANFHITIEDEILKCTTRTVDVLTVTRAQESTTAAAHAAGKAVRLNITAEVLDGRTTWTSGKLLKGAGAGVAPTEEPAGISCKATKTASQDILNGTEAVLTFPAEDWDTDTMHDLVTNNSRITIKTAGKYQFVGYIGFNTNATGSRSACLKKAGSAIQYCSVVAVPQAGWGTDLFITNTLDCAVNDYFELAANQTSGGTLAVTSSCFFIANRIV